MRLTKILKFLLEEVVYGGHILCIGAGAIVIAVSLLFSKTVNLSYAVIIYLVAYSSYLFNRYKEVDIDIYTNPERTKHFMKYKKYTPYILLCTFLIGILIMIIDKRISFIPYYLLLYFGGISYTLCFKNLSKKIPLFKNLFVSLEWTLPVVFLPIYFPSFHIYLSPFILTVFLIYLKTFILNSYFDIKDVKIDREKGLKTLSTILTVKKHLKCLKVLSLILGVILIFGILLFRMLSRSILLLTTVIFDLFIFEETEKGRISLSKLYFWAGSEFVLWPILILIGDILL